MTSNNIFLSVLAVLLVAASCGGPGPLRTDENDPGVVYDPPMYWQPSYKPLRQSGENTLNPYGANVRPPAPHTIPYGKKDFIYPYPNTTAGYDSAKKHLKNPLPLTAENLKEGQRLYQIYCVYCHGEKGDADGILVQKGKYPPPPLKYKDRPDLTEGSIFHVITYGKGLMGSHASQLWPEQRWKVVQYVQALQHQNDSLASQYWSLLK